MPRKKEKMTRGARRKRKLQGKLPKRESNSLQSTIRKTLFINFKCSRCTLVNKMVTMILLDCILIRSSRLIMRSITEVLNLEWVIPGNTGPRQSLLYQWYLKITKRTKLMKIRALTIWRLLREVLQLSTNIRPRSVLGKSKTSQAIRPCKILRSTTKAMSPIIAVINSPKYIFSLRLNQTKAVQPI